MAFQLSPGVTVVEKDFSSIVPAVSTSAGAFAGVFPWGPVLDPVTITSENVLVQRYGKPTDANAQSFFTAANFLSYTNNLLVVRADTETHRNAVATSTGSVTGVTVGTPGTGYSSAPTVTFSAPQIAGGITATGTAVLGGTVTAVAVTTPGSGYVTGVTITFSAPQLAGGTTATGTVTITNGEVAGIVITNGGSGYTSAPTATLGNVGGGTLAVLGAVTAPVNRVFSVTVTNPGSGYSSAPSVTFGSGAAAATATVALSGVKINNFDVYSANYENGNGVFGEWAAKYPGALGNSIKVSMADSASYRSVVTGTISGSQTSTTLTVTGGSLTTQAITGTYVEFWSGANGSGQILGTSVIASVTDATTAVLVTNPNITTGIVSIVFKWQYNAEFDSAPSTSSASTAVSGTNDELHVVVIDADGTWSGISGTILEKFAYVSKARDNLKTDGSNNYYRDVINSQSRYIWWMDHVTTGTNWGSVGSTAFATLTKAYTVTLSGGVDDLTATDGQLQTAYSIFANDELYDISLVALGKASATVATYVINNVVEVRKDCIAFISPQNVTSGDIITGTGSDAILDLVAYRNLLPSTSYAVLDSGYKYQYDRYNDKYRYVPLNGDIAGLCARTDYTADPWFSPGGFNRGQVKNVVKLAINPGKTERDNLYKAGVNPVVNFPGQGAVLFGDKTLLSKPSAFDRINVRRLFIVLEKAIATAAKFQLFEFNDSFTRAQFKNLVEPFLRDVQGRRGVTDFRVKCDDANNTSEVIDRNEFVADIFIKPNRSINFITLNFVAARSSVSFEEIGL